LLLQEGKKQFIPEDRSLGGGYFSLARGAEEDLPAHLFWRESINPVWQSEISSCIVLALD